MFQLLIEREDLIAVSRTCRRLREIALDNSLWWPICERILLSCLKLDPDQTLPLSRVDLVEWDASSYFELYKGIFGWEPYLGWYVPAGFHHESDVMRCSVDIHGNISLESMRITQEFNDAQPLLPGTRLAHFHWGIHIIVMQPGREPVSISVQDISYRTIEQYSWNWRQSDDNFQEATESVWDEWNIYEPRSLLGTSRLFPSPSMLPAIRNGTLSPRGNLVCAAYLHTTARTPVYLPIHTPYSHAWDRSPLNPIDSGLYVASYGAHGTELLSVVFRTLTVADFDHQNSRGSSYPDPLPWDFHLSANDPLPHQGPFPPHVERRGNVHASDICPGQRIMEVTKLTGDQNVPRGQRSLIAFLDIASPEATSHDMRKRNRTIADIQLSGRSDIPIPVLPKTSSRRAVAPWPIPLVDQNNHDVPARIMSDEEMMSEGAGWSVSGIGRISPHGFVSPSWAPCTVHFASREEFQSMWLGMVMTFTRLN